MPWVWVLPHLRRWDRHARTHRGPTSSSCSARAIGLTRSASTGIRSVVRPTSIASGREGIQFSNSFTVNALCLPARSAALTGLYTHSTGCVDNKGRVIPEEVPLFTDLLRNAGYEVALFGKAHIGGLRRARLELLFRFSRGGHGLFLAGH